MADRIGVMNQGRLVQVATPAEVYEQPNSRWVASFVGDVNMMECTLVESGPLGGALECAGLGRMRVARRIDGPNGAMLWIALRPEKIQLAAQGAPTPDENCFAGTVREIGYLGDLSIYKIRTEGGFDIKVSAASRTRLGVSQIVRGDRVTVSWPADAGVVLTQ